MKTRTWVLIVAALLILSVLLSLWVVRRKAPGTVANVYQDGTCIRSVDLAQVTEPYEFTVSGEWGENVIRVEPGRICVQSADCPDRICVDAGWLSDSAQPIVCLPHKLVIRLEAQAKSDRPDAVSR